MGPPPGALAAAAGQVGGERPAAAGAPGVPTHHVVLHQVADALPHAGADEVGGEAQEDGAARGRPGPAQPGPVPLLLAQRLQLRVDLRARRGQRQRRPRPPPGSPGPGPGPGARTIRRISAAACAKLVAWKPVVRKERSRAA